LDFDKKEFEMILKKLFVFLFIFVLFFSGCAYKYKDPFDNAPATQPSSDRQFEESPKKVLVLSGGFFRGAFQVGALEYLLNVYRAEFDTVVGTSIGALHAFAIVQEDVEFLKNIWTKIEKMDDAFSTDIISVTESVLFRGGFFAHKPLARLLDKYFNAQKLFDSPTRLMVGVVCYETGEFLLKDQYSEDIKRFILASALIPGFTPPVKVGGLHYFDGGVRSVMPVAPFVRKGVEEIVMISCFNKDDLIVPAEMAKTKELNMGKFGSIIDFGTRTVEIINHQNFAQEIEYALKTGLQRGIKATLIEPDQGKCQYGVLEFDKEKFDACVKHGYEKAMRVLNR